jgi:anti-sigma-K factor RskA
MTLGDHFTDELPLYALDALEGEECLAVERHLRECSDCRNEVERFKEDWALIGFSARGASAPAGIRDRLINATSREPGQHTVRVRKRPIWLGMLQWAAAAAAILTVVFLVRQNNDLHAQLERFQARSVADEQELRQARELVSALTSSNADRFTLVAGNTPPQPQGKAIYDARTGTLLFLANNLPPVPSHKAYELWLIPANGAAPIPAGVFKPNERGTASLIRPSLPSRIEAKTFAVTVEPESGSSAPTSQPMMVGTRS